MTSRQDWERGRRRRRLAAAVVGTLLGWGLTGLQPLGLEVAQLHLEDALNRALPANPDPAAITVIEIDGQAVERFGPWPWPRHRTARLMQAIAAGDPSAVFVDAVFAGETTHDAALRDALDALGPRMVAGVGVSLTDPDRHDMPGGLRPRVDAPHAEPATIVMLPSPTATGRENRLAMLALAPTVDGISRELPCAAGFGDRSLICAPIEVAVAAGGDLSSLLGGLDARGMLRLRMVGDWLHSPWSHYSAATLVEALDGGSIDDLREALAGRIVLVGVVAAGTGDIVHTPFESIAPGVWLHVNAVNQLLSGQTPRRIPAAPLVALSLLVAVLVGLWGGSRTWHWGLGGALQVAAVAAGTPAAFALGGWILPTVPLLLTASGQTLGALIWGYYSAWRERERVSTALRRYMAPEIVELLHRRPELLAPGMDKKRLSIMFTDIKGFTALSNRSSADTLMGVLNEYLDEMTRIFFRHHGTIDKIMGDGILAIFGAPEDVPDHAMRAVAAGMEMQRAMTRLTADWEARGLGRLQIRVGINTDEVFVGNIGTLDHIEYTVIGAGVNLAQRLESAAPPGGILVGEGTWRDIQDRVDATPTDITAKGYDGKVPAWEVRGLRKGG